MTLQFPVLPSYRSNYDVWYESKLSCMSKYTQGERGPLVFFPFISLHRYEMQIRTQEITNHIARDWRMRAILAQTYDKYFIYRWISYDKYYYIILYYIYLLLLFIVLIVNEHRVVSIQQSFHKFSNSSECSMWNLWPSFRDHFYFNHMLQYRHRRPKHTFIDIH